MEATSPTALPELKPGLYIMVGMPMSSYLRSEARIFARAPQDPFAPPEDLLLAEDIAVRHQAHFDRAANWDLYLHWGGPRNGKIFRLVDAGVRRKPEQPPAWALSTVVVGIDVRNVSRIVCLAKAVQMDSDAAVDHADRVILSKGVNTLPGAPAQDMRTWAFGMVGLVVKELLAHQQSITPAVNDTRILHAAILAWAVKQVDSAILDIKPRPVLEFMP